MNPRYLLAASAAISLSIPALAQSDKPTESISFNFSPPVGEFGYEFVPSSPTSQWGGELWFTEPLSSAGNPFDDLDTVSSFLITPDGPVNILLGEALGSVAVTPTLPQSPYPYTGTLNVDHTQGNVNISSFFGDSTHITSMDLSGDTFTEFVGSFTTPGIAAVTQDINWEITQDGISESTDYNGLSSIDPSVAGQWVAIPDQNNTLALLGATAGLLMAGKFLRNGSRTA